jgi:hypothetical protein
VAHLVAGQRHEAAGGFQFDYVTWMRLDVAWEVQLAPAFPVALPASHPDAVWVPEMNSQSGGMCDKFA